MVDSVPVSNIGDSGLGFTGCGEVSCLLPVAPRSQQFAEWKFSREAFTG